MDAKLLHAKQQPLKKRYREEPQSALYVLRAKGRLHQDRIAVQILSHGGGREVGLHPATGGDGRFVCSGDLLLEALAACAGVTLLAVATAMDIRIEDGVVKAEGDLDFRGTLGVARDVPVGFKAVRLHFDLATDTGPKQMGTLMRRTRPRPKPPSHPCSKGWGTTISRSPPRCRNPRSSSTRGCG